MSHYPHHLAIGVALFVATLFVRVVTTNRLIHRKLRLSMLVFAAYAAANVAITWYPLPAGVSSQMPSVERLLLAAGLINLIVVLAINPWRTDRVPERFPSIVQDTIVFGVFVAFGVFVMQEKFLTISAIGGVVVGFALQDTLGNLFAGLALQSEKPFRVGHWITVGEFEGRVTEITWRATRLHTKAGNFVVVPNNIIAKEAITNYSEPSLPTRLHVDVGVSYGVPPNEVKAVMIGAAAQAPGVLKMPPPETLVLAFADSAITYRVRFWIDDFSKDLLAKDRVLTAVYYALRRRGFEIPFPMQIQYERVEQPGRPPERTAGLEQVAGGVDMLAPLSDSERADLVAASGEQIYGAGETIVREGQPGDSMFVICSGSVRVTIGPTRQEVATIPAGGCFGEMSLLTGDPRTADVTAIEDCHLLEITAQTFRRIFLANPLVVEKVAAVVETRRAGLARSREAVQAEAVVTHAPTSLLGRIQKFLRLS
ncbi:MAG: mechanosensitive ion channel [Acidobacteria bacterium]|nr:mechanosensitive ion channel [Acidobacteriota bacterium]